MTPPPTTILAWRALALSLACGGALALTSCGKKTSPTPTPKPATPANAGQLGTNSLAANSNLFVSVFLDQPGTGRDPFFPRSARRVKVVETRVVTPEETVVAPINLNTSLVLRGFLGTNFATINNRTLSVGESGDFLVANERGQPRTIRVKLLSINTNYTCQVTVDDDPEPKELSRRRRTN